MTVEYRGDVASCQAKDIIRAAEKRIKKVEKATKAEETPSPVVEMPDYKAMNMKKLVEELDSAVKSFGKDPSAATFAPILLIKEAIDEKIDDMPAAQRAPLGKAMADRGLYVQAINTQLTMPMVNIASFAGTYVPQMKAAVSALAAAIE